MLETSSMDVTLGGTEPFPQEEIEDFYNIDYDINYNGLNVFLKDNAFRFFTIESIFRSKLGDDNLEAYLEETNMFMAIGTIFHNQRRYARNEKKSIVDLQPLFWLLSVLPEDAARECKRVMDRDSFAWKVTVYDILIVLLNWGATLDSLDVECLASLLEGAKMLPPHDWGNNKQTFPRSWNVRLVMMSISQRLPEESVMPLHAKAAVIKMLMFACMDKQQRGNMIHMTSAIHSVLKSFRTSDNLVATRIADGLGSKWTRSMGAQNAVYLCCCVFNMVSDLTRLVGLHLCYKLLRRMGLACQSSLVQLVTDLRSPGLFDRFTLHQLYHMCQLINSVLLRHAHHPLPQGDDRPVADIRSEWPHFDQETVQSLHNWTMEVRNALNDGVGMFSLLKGYLRERLSRLSSECATVIRQQKHKWDDGSNISPDSSM